MTLTESCWCCRPTSDRSWAPFRLAIPCERLLENPTGAPRPVSPVSGRISMPVELGWHDILLRLALTVAAGFLLGIDRSERGRAAGLRTGLLVCLAASVAMIQANLLLATAGKSPD